MSEFTKVRFVLAVRDLAQSTQYYTSVLGLTVDFHAGLVVPLPGHLSGHAGRVHRRHSA
jgi:catechol 2,3-dioxygenase-like lactoylglutathione lyase family enzyme